MTEDAIIKEAKPGFKSGNAEIDEINLQLRKEGIIERLKRLYRKS